jgi:hypothetical protein
MRYEVAQLVEALRYKPHYNWGVRAAGACG